MLIHLISAARPNFMKIAPLYHALKKEVWAVPVIVHTGQHYDSNMSDAFFKDLNLPEPHIHLCIGSGSHAEQTGQVMIAFEKVLFEKQPDMVIVVGDVNSTMACTLAASKIKYPAKFINDGHDNPCSNYELSAMNHVYRRRPLIAHLEAGLRSFDRSMPEEVNRIVTDSLADLLWTPSPDGDENLIREGISEDKIVRVGNIMIDSLEMLREKIEQKADYNKFGVKRGEYGLITLHRPSNVDSVEIFTRLCEILTRLSKKLPLIFPVHPRTRNNLEKYNLLQILNKERGILLTDPMNYLSFMNLVFNCRLVVTDSGGIQEETTYLGIPCLTLRPNTERPITINQGTNMLCSIENIEKKVDETLSKTGIDRKCNIEFWDGKTADRVVESIKTELSPFI